MAALIHPPADCFLHTCFVFSVVVQQGEQPHFGLDAEHDVVGLQDVLSRFLRPHHDHVPLLAAILRPRQVIHLHQRGLIKPIRNVGVVLLAQPFQLFRYVADHQTV